jgi:hypothetical protein
MEANVEDLDVPSSAKKLKRSQIEEEDRKRIQVKKLFFFFLFFSHMGL